MSWALLPIGAAVNAATVTLSGSPETVVPAIAAGAGEAAGLAAVARFLLRPAPVSAARTTGAPAVAPAVPLSATTAAGRSGSAGCDTGFTTGAPLTTAMATTAAMASLACDTRPGLVTAAWLV